MIDGNTKVCGVIGNPVQHTLSPMIHNYLSEKYGVNMIYTPFLVEDSGLKDAVMGIKGLGMRGVNVTVPYKQEVVRFMDELSDVAKELKSVNTIINDDDMLFGYNTDSYGFSMLLKHEEVDLTDKKILLLGAGGATPSVVYSLLSEPIETVDILNRTKEKATNIANNMKKLGYKNVRVGALEEKYDIIINATSVGLSKEDVSPLSDYSLVHEDGILIDLLYNPKKTIFLEIGEALGIRGVNGLSMLIYQAFYAYELFTGIMPSYEDFLYLQGVLNQ